VLAHCHLQRCCMISLFNIVHILQLVMFENMLSYENVNSYIQHLFKLEPGFVELQLYFMAKNFFPIVDVFISLDNYQTKFCCVRYKVLCSLSFSSSILTHFSLFFFTLLSVFGSILSRISMLVSSWGDRLRNSISIYISTS
jgi:hypothetical protein